jgi:predicted nucleic acid-binding protein
LVRELSRNYGLLSNDAVHLATMQKEGAKTLASNDRDFERADWVKLWKP